MAVENYYPIAVGALHEVTFQRVFKADTTWMSFLYVVNNSPVQIETIAEVMALNDDFSTNFSLKTSGRYFEDSSIQTYLQMDKNVVRQFTLGVPGAVANEKLFEAASESANQTGALHLYMGRVPDSIDGVTFYSGSTFQTVSFYI